MKLSPGGSIIYSALVKPVSLPPVPLKGDAAQRRFNDAVRVAIEAMYVGDNRFATAAEVPSLVVPPVDPDAPGGTPPAPFNLAADGAFENIILTWDYADYEGHAYTRIFRNTIDEYETAAVIGNTEGKVWADPVGMDQSFYYWVALVNEAGTQGPPNGVAGTLGQTAPDVDYLLEQLEGEILASSLHADLSSRIDLIDADAGTPGSVAQQVAAEMNARIDAITAEALAREAGDAANATSFESLAAQLHGGYDGSSLEEVTYGLIAQERNARVTATEALAEQISLLTAGVSGGFDPFKTWYFDASAESWAGTNATVTVGNGVIAVDGTGSDPSVQQSADLSPAVNGGQYNVVKARVKRVAGSGWAGILRWKTSGHDFGSGNQEVTDTASPAVDEWVVVEWNLQSVTDWTSSQILNMQFILGVDASDDFEIDWISVGRNGPAASVASLLNEQQVRAAADSAEAMDRQALSVSLTGTADPSGETLDTLTSGLIYEERTARATQTGTLVTQMNQLQATYETDYAAVQVEMSAQADAIEGIQAQYTIKVDANGRVAGIGLMVDENGSQIQMIADKFAIVIPGVAGSQPKVPFVVTTINGVAAVGISAAFIGDAAIVRAKIADAAIDNAKIASLSAAKVTFGEMSGDRIAVNTLNANRIITDTLVAKLALITDAYITNANIENLTIAGEKFQPNAVSNCAYAMIAVGGDGELFTLGTWMDFDTAASGGSTTGSAGGSGGSGGGVDPGGGGGGMNMPNTGG